VTGDCHAGIRGSRGLRCPRRPDWTKIRIPSTTGHVADATPPGEPSSLPVLASPGAGRPWTRAHPRRSAIDAVVGGVPATAAFVNKEKSRRRSCSSGDQSGRRIDRQGDAVLARGQAADDRARREPDRDRDVLAAIGDIARFSSSRRLVAYLGLDPRVRQSGEQPARSGRISKRGSASARVGLRQRPPRRGWSGSTGPARGCCCRAGTRPATGSGCSSMRRSGRRSAPPARRWRPTRRPTQILALVRRWHGAAREVLEPLPARLRVRDGRDSGLSRGRAQWRALLRRCSDRAAGSLARYAGGGLTRLRSASGDQHRARTTPWPRASSVSQ